MGRTTWSDYERLGDALDAVANVAADVATNTFSAEINNLKAENQRLIQNQQRQQARSIYATLDEVIGPQWRQINRSQEFNAWLQNRPGFSGLTGRQMIEHHFATGNAEYVVRLFQGYLAEAGQAPQQQSTSQRQPRRRQVQQGISADQIKAHYAKARLAPDKGGYPNDQARDAMELQIHRLLHGY